MSNELKQRGKQKLYYSHPFWNSPLSLPETKITPKQNKKSTPLKSQVCKNMTLVPFLFLFFALNPF